MNVTIDLMNASGESNLPAPGDFRHWSETALAAVIADDHPGLPDDQELSIRVVDESESAQLNGQYRHKDGPTNILSFPVTGIPGTGINLLGDLAICAPLVRREALEQGKTEQAHWAHLTVHGVLHLSGYDHMEPAEAQRMESLEVRIMDTLGYPDPYHTVPSTPGKANE